MPKNVERVMGIEPTLVAWEATVLPLNYTRALLAHLVAALLSPASRRLTHRIEAMCVKV
jgi:hypothetical protein